MPEALTPDTSPSRKAWAAVHLAATVVQWLSTGVLSRIV